MQQAQHQSSDKSTLLEYSEVTEYEMIQNSPGGIEATLAAHKAGWLPHNAPLIDVTYKGAASLLEIFPKRSQWRYINNFQVLFIFGKMGTAVALINAKHNIVDIDNVIVFAQQENGSFKQFTYSASKEKVKSNTAMFKKIREHIGNLSTRMLATTGMIVDKLVQAKLQKDQVVTARFAPGPAISSVQYFNMYYSNLMNEMFAAMINAREEIERATGHSVDTEIVRIKDELKNDPIA